MSRVFLSYRRGDTEGQARALAQALTARFGRDAVFMDVDSIALGRDFRQVVAERVSSCDVFLALIGPRWLDASDGSGRRRLDDPTDFVRHEIATALTRDIPVTPVLMQGAQMPPADRLPPDIQPLVFRNGISIGHEKWDSDVNELISRLGLEPAAPSSPAAASSPLRGWMGAVAAVVLVAVALAASAVWSPWTGGSQRRPSPTAPAVGADVEPKVPERTTPEPRQPEHPNPKSDAAPTSESESDRRQPAPPKPDRLAVAPMPERPDLRAIGPSLVARWHQARADHDMEKIFEIVGEPLWFGERLMNREQLWEQLENFAARGRRAQARSGAPAPSQRWETLGVRVMPAREFKAEFRQTEFRDQLFGEGLRAVGLTLDSEVVELTERVPTGAVDKTLYLIRINGNRAELVGQLGDCGLCGLARVTP
jgi:hypothetical protein